MNVRRPGGGPHRARCGAALRRPYPAERPDAERLPWRSTLLIAVFVQFGTGFAAHGQPEGTGLDPFAHVLLLVAPLLLLVRGRHPVLAVYGVSLTSLLHLGAGYPYGPVLLALAVGVFSATVAGHRHAARTALGLVWAGHLALTHLLYARLPPDGDDAAPRGRELVVAAWVCAIAAASELVRVRCQQWAHQRAERAQAEKHRAQTERLRIARELHDVLAHSISVISPSSPPAPRSPRRPTCWAG